MELEHSFTVPVPKSRAWDVLLDVERVAPCMPGASLDSVDGDEIRGRIKVKVGPINMTYAGTARFVERDQELGVVTLEATGKETRGAGTASASVRSVLEDRGEETHVKVLTTLNVTGKPAQFGRGVMNEVGGRLLGIFANNLAATLAEDEGQGSGGAASSPNGESGTAPGPAAAANVVGPGATAQAAGSKPASDQPIDDLKLPPRATSSLRKNGIETVGQLASKTEDELLAIDGIGRASIDDISAKLSDRGLGLRQPQAAAASAAPAASGAAPSAPGTAPAAAASAPTPAAGGPASVVPHASAARHAAHQLEDDAINLLKVAGLPVLKRAVPVLAGLAAALVIGLRRKARRRKH
ncbi:MAG: SRPBCC domain-containing protein [Streptosporangiaceae bacterium]